MPLLTPHSVTNYVEDHIGEFHARRLQSLRRLKLKHILKRKNPYLFKAKNILTGADLVRTCLLYTSPSPRDRTRSRMPSSA